MRSLRSIITMVLALMTFPIMGVPIIGTTDASAQVAPPPSADMQSWYQYQSLSKNPMAAAGIELAIPCLGMKFGGGEWSDCKTTGIVRGAGFALMIYGSGSGDAYGPNMGAISLGWLAWTVGAVWGAIDAHGIAEDHNLALRQRLNIAGEAMSHLQVMPAPGGGTQVGFSIPTNW